MSAIARAGVVFATATATLIAVSSGAALQSASRSAPENPPLGETAVTPSARTDDVARIFGAPPPGASTTTTHFDVTDFGGYFGHSPPCSGCSATATVDVSGLSGSLWDVDARVRVLGGNYSTVTVNLYSPAGTLVHLLSMGYVGNSGEPLDDSSAVLLTDGGAPSLTTPIAPQGALGRLIGEDPNGTWSVQVTDDLCVYSLGMTCAHVSVFSLDITTLDTPLAYTPLSVTNATPSSIPSPGSVTSDITVSGAGSSLCEVNVRTFINHPRSSDFDISITSPSGTIVKLVTRVGPSNLHTHGSARVFNGSLWDDQATPPLDATNYPYVSNTAASPIIGEGKLGRFIGEDPNGTWHLTISDSVADIAGTLTSWSLELTTCELAEPGTVYCTGDGLDTVLTAECPCGNLGGPGRGCANSNSALGGARMWATGTTSPNTLVFHCEGMPNNSLATFWRGSMNDANGVVFNDGIQCVAGAIIRFDQQVAGQGGNEPFSIAGPAVALAPGTTRYYQTHYRNPNAGFCPPGLFNLSNGYVVTW